MQLAHKEVFFRRLNHSDHYPICSWITAFAYEQALHYRFEGPPECEDSDQIYDWVEANPKEWTLIFRYGI